MDNLGKNWQLINILFCAYQFTIGEKCVLEPILARAQPQGAPASNNTYNDVMYLILIAWLSTSQFFWISSSVHHTLCLTQDLAMKVLIGEDSRTKFIGYF